MEDPLSLKPRAYFEIEKILGISNDGSYHVQWATTWVSKYHLIGCEHLVDEYIQQQAHQQQQQQQDHHERVITDHQQHLFHEELSDLTEQRHEATQEEKTPQELEIFIQGEHDLIQLLQQVQQQQQPVAITVEPQLQDDDQQQLSTDELIVNTEKHLLINVVTDLDTNVDTISEVGSCITSNVALQPEEQTDETDGSKRDKRISYKLILL